MQREAHSLTHPSTSGIVDFVQSGTNDSRENGHPSRRWRLIARWLEPGLGVKRWLVLIVIGTALLGLGVAIVMLDIYRANPESELLALISMAALPRVLRAFVLGSLGVAVLVYAVFRLNRSLLAPYMRPGKPVVEAVAQHRRLGRGPKIVAIGGGTGLSTLLRGLKKGTGNLTAIVSVADDGGSSGRLRQSLGLPPPGDIRACLAALSNDEDLLTQLFHYRFSEGDDLGGHSFGNLFIAAISDVTGSFQEGVMEAGRVLAIRGQVLPSTASTISLVADKVLSTEREAVRIEGESRLSSGPGKIRRVQLEPNDPPAYPPAIQAILNADMIVIGPGSLYTSILPNLLVPDITKAIRASRAFKVYVCNVATQPGETDKYNCPEHWLAVEAHIGREIVDIIIANDNLSGELPEGVQAVDPCIDGNSPEPLYVTDLVDPDLPSRHDPDLLAEALIALLEERTGPLDLSPLNGEKKESD